MFCVNSFILWNFTKPKRRSQMTHGQFLEQLSNEMVTFLPPASESTTHSLWEQDALNTLPLPIFCGDGYNMSLHNVCICQPGEGYKGADWNQKRCAHPTCKKSSWYFCEVCRLNFCTNFKQFEGKQTCFQHAH